MKKVWIYKRKGVRGWWIGWYESDKRKVKALPSKALVEHFRQIKYTQLNRWKKIRHKLGLDDFKFHDLRKTFGSVLAQNGISTAVTQKLLEHSSPDLTNKIICRPFSQIGYIYIFSKPQFKENGHGKKII
jgi:integrase